MENRFNVEVSTDKLEVTDSKLGITISSYMEGSIHKTKEKIMKYIDMIDKYQEMRLCQFTYKDDVFFVPVENCEYFDHTNGNCTILEMFPHGNKSDLNCERVRSCHFKELCVKQNELENANNKIKELENGQ